MQRTGENVEPIQDATPVTVVVGGHEWTLYEESTPLIADMVADIRAAERRVWMESYIFADDTAGRAVADALAEQAAAGVDVRLMVDAWGVLGTRAAMFDRLRAAGVKLHVYHDFREALFAVGFWRVLNERNHRKLLAIDDRVAYFGGMNIVDTGVIHTKADAKVRHLPASAGWRDVHARLVGPRAAEIAAMCDRLWRRARGPARGKSPRWSVPEVLKSSADSFFFFGSRPRFRFRRPTRILAPLLRSARQEIILSVAYFLPLGRVLKELVRAARRGVRVQVIVPGRSDVAVMQWATRHLYEFLLARGIEVHERKDRMLHSKVIVIDGRWSVIGSCNLDARSLRTNLEFFAVIHSPAMADALLSICREEMDASLRVTAVELRRRTWWRRTLDRAAWSFRRWL